MMCEERAYYNDTRDYANHALEKAVARLHEEILHYAQCSKLSDDTLELDIGVFRKYTSNTERILPELKDCVEHHILLSANTFGENGIQVHSTLL